MTRRHIIHLFAVVCSLFLFASNSSAQNDFTYPSDVWPYLYKEFSTGRAYVVGGKTIDYQFNVCVDGTLHFIDEKNQIMEVGLTNLHSVIIDQDKYINTGRGLMLVVQGETDPLVLKSVKASDNSSSGADIGYGMTSSNYAASNVDLTATSSFGAALLHSQVEKASKDREYGNPLKMEETFWMKIGLNTIKASKNDFLEFVGKDKGNQWLKANKIKWNNPQSILSAAEFAAGK